MSGKISEDPAASNLSNLVMAGVQNGDNVKVPAGLFAAQNQIFTVTLEQFGAPVDGISSDQDALNLAHAALVQAGGGVIQLGIGPYNFPDRVTLPNDGSQSSTFLPALQVPITWQGVGNDTDCPAGTVKTPKGTIIKLGYQDTTPGWAGVGARIQTLGRGTFRLRNLNICAAANTPVGVASTPLLLTTNTSLDIDSSVSFYGPGNRQGASADCDAIVLGGLTTSLLNGNDAAFQGYGTQIKGSYFSSIRRGVYGRTYCNGVTVSDLKFWADCGSNLTDGAAVEFDGQTPQNCTGNLISGLLVEQVHYPFAVKLKASLFNTVVACQGFDGGVGVAIGVVLCDTDSYGNIVVAGMPLSSSRPNLVDRCVVTGGRNLLISNQATEKSVLYSLKAGTAASANDFDNTVFTGTPSLRHPLVQPAVSGAINAATSFEIKRNPSESVDASVTVFKTDYAGGVSVNGANAGNYANGLATGASWSANGKTWGFVGTSGGAMIQNSGTGGSAFTAQNNSFSWKDQTGALQAKFWSNAGASSGIGFDFGPSGDVSLFRLSATILKTNAKMITTLGLGVGNSAAATTLGTVTKKMEVFDAAGASLGFVPIYDAIT